MMRTFAPFGQRDLQLVQAGLILQMAHTHSVMAEVIAGIIEGIAALIELVIHALALLAKGSATLVLFSFSANYRARKRVEWHNQPIRKVLALGFSGLCLATLFGFAIWLALAVSDSGKAKSSRQTHFSDSNYFSLNIRRTNQLGSNQVIHIAIPEGAVGKILSATNRTDLLSRLKSSMVVTSQAGSAGTNVSPGDSVEIKIGPVLSEK